MTAFAGGESDFVVALAADTGDELWRYRIAETYKGHDGSNDGPLATPMVFQDVVYGLGARGEPEGYREKARTRALRRGSWTRPSFAGGRVYVRDLRDIAAVRVIDEAPAAVAALEEEATPAGEPRGKIGELVRRAEAVQDKSRGPVADLQSLGSRSHAGIDRE